MTIKTTKIINPINIEGRNLRPLNEYKGEILKLTKSDRAKITNYETQIAALECDLYDLNKRIKPKMQMKDWDYWVNKIIVCEYRIKVLKDLVREIKVNRFNIQNLKQK